MSRLSGWRKRSSARSMEKIAGSDPAREAALRLVGGPIAVNMGEVDVNPAMIKYFCSAIEDDNPSYWSEDFATRQWGGIVSPPGMLQTWVIPLLWRPDGPRQLYTGVDVPLPTDTLINVSTDIEYYRPILVGERLSAVDEVVDISEKKMTRLGPGYFVIWTQTYTCQKGEVVAKLTNTIFHYKSRELR